MKHSFNRAALPFFGVWLAAMLLAAPLHAHADEAQQFTLTNGMTLIVKPDHRAPTAVHMLWVRVGSMDEVDGSSGVARCRSTRRGSSRCTRSFLPIA